MTYERPKILRKTLLNLLNQTYPPQFILVVDNSSSKNTAVEVKNIDSDLVDYLRVGYNSGPAGAAKIGLQILTSMGFEWIYWGDDDNPPRDNKVFQRSMNSIQFLLSRDIKVGVFGGKGGNFNRITGRIKSLSNKELVQAELLEVDTVPGGHDMFVSSDVVKEGILPDERLFFGFEEFDFCLKVKEASFRIYIDAASWLRERRQANKRELSYRWKGRSFGNQNAVTREFFSTRNLMFIFYERRLFMPFLTLLSKILIKMIFALKYGRKYGFSFIKVQCSAISAFISGKLGNPDSPFHLE